MCMFMQGRYNCARDFYECREEIRFNLPTPKICPFCNARLFCNESSTICCMKGKISFPNLPISEPLMDLFCEQSEQFEKRKKRKKKKNEEEEKEVIHEL